MVPFSFGGQDFTALPEGALFWPARQALLVADLHLEKASWYAGGGQMLPPYDSLATLTELTQAHAFAKPITTRIEQGGFFPAEADHQNFYDRNPGHPYIVRWDKPKVAGFRAGFPDLARAG